MESILFVNWYANRSGGADSYTHDLAVGLSQRGHKVAIACLDATVELRARATVLPLRRPTLKQYPAVWRFDPFAQLASLAFDVAKLQTASPDVVINSLPFAAGPLRRRFPRARHLYFPHALVSPVEVAGYQTGLSAKLGRFLYATTERAAVVRSWSTIRFTRHNVDVMRDYYKLSKAPRFDVIPPAVAFPEKIEPARSEAVRLLFVGRLVESKNVAFLLSALANLPANNWTLDVLGDGPLRSDLETQTQNAGLAARVRFHGHQADLAPFYRSADLFAFPSRLENLGLVMLEAMAHGVPVLAFQNDGVRYRNSSHEFITTGSDGFLAADEAAFASTLAGLLTSPAPLRLAGERARARVAASHTWPAVLDRWQLRFARDFSCRPA